MDLVRGDHSDVILMQSPVRMKENDLHDRTNSGRVVVLMLVLMLVLAWNSAGCPTSSMNAELLTSTLPPLRCSQRVQVVYLYTADERLEATVSQGLGRCW